MTFRPARCYQRRCKHLLHLLPSGGKYPQQETPEYTTDQPPWWWTCKAYPKGIPLSILKGDDLHGEVREDQEGEWVYEEGEDRLHGPVVEIDDDIPQDLHDR